ncbi:hypothetical protein P280DRAFT_474422 [Massarina eburnea CBS 473.64]|uniref:Uncharacterized protein n=1 Tax=Massarina eburnea CBS 473.64 TaxID=1395130 RepID=A0A6A6RL36_9PLEO|nr:hypothetical protein P280DRAFT_474422 [Massarina eburnea CBS 473.64]
MDSMRSLNTSLPKTRRRQPTPQPDTHQAFRSAALTVTNLYKNALADIDRARSDGYQQALEDLLGLVDKEEIGLGSGEGRRIRQWATERLDGALPTSDSEEEEDKRARSSSPAMERNSSPEDTRAIERAAEPGHDRSDSAPPPVSAEPSVDGDMTPLPTMFHFSSPQTYPASSPVDNAPYDLPTAARRAFPAPRRPSHRSSSRNMQRAAAQNVVALGNGAGQKRKLMQDFFNLDFNNDRREGPGGGNKRGRMS